MKSLFNNPDNFLGMELNETINELYKTLDNLSNLIKQHNFSLKMIKLKNIQHLFKKLSSDL